MAFLLYGSKVYGLEYLSATEKSQRAKYKKMKKSIPHIMVYGEFGISIINSGRRTYGIILV